MKRVLYASVVLGILICLAPHGRAQDQDWPYPVQPVYPPALARPSIQPAIQALPAEATGQLPGYDGEFFRVNLKPESGVQASTQGAEDILGKILSAIGWSRSRDDLRALEPQALPQGDSKTIEAEIQRAEAETRRRLQGELGKINQASEEAIREQVEEARRLAQAQTRIYRYVQYYQGVAFENTSLQVIWRSGEGFSAVTGRAFNQVTFTNSRRLNADAAQLSAEKYIGQYTEVSGAPKPRPEMVILPYGEGFKYAWRMDVTAVEGPYRVWVDAENGKVLQLDPLFFFDGGRGLVFNPDPTTGTVEKTFEVDAPSGGQYRLRLSGVLDVNNSGADGVCSGDVTVAAGSGEANFNVSPINGTVVQQVNQTDYNCRFQEVNVYAWVHEHINTFTNTLGGNAFGTITATVNNNNPCGFGINNACASGTTSLTFGIGGGTANNSTNFDDLFNTAIDVTVVTHEFGHLVNNNNYGSNIRPFMNEGLADFWCYTIHNVNTIAAWSAQNRGLPANNGRLPRQADVQDVFPEHRAFATSAHADGEMIAWALWSARQELNAISALGTLNINTNLMDAIATASGTTGTTDRIVHDNYLNLLQQLAPLYATSRNIHKILTGFARAGIYLSERDAVIDISDDFLNRNDAGGPTFTVFTGRDYTFNADGSANTGTQPFNTRFTIEVANDEAFTVNLVSSGVQSGVAASSGGVGSWTLPAADWNTLKTQNQLFYRVTTTNSSGGTVRTSGNPGNGFLANVPPGRATINESGECECTCGASAATPRSVAAVTLFPVLLALFWLRRLKRKENR